MKKIIIIIFSFVILITIFILILQIPFISNVWNLLTGRGFVIPKESSIFTFKTIVMNDGSGEWWLYGEDKFNYYYFLGDNSKPYIIFSKNEAINCPGFNKTDYKTWCLE